jgi:PAS domain S-box-containing protein
MERTLDIVLNSLEDGILCVDERRNLVLINEAAARLFPGTPSPVVGQPISVSRELVEAVRQLKLEEFTGAEPPVKVIRRLNLAHNGNRSLPFEAIVSSTTLGGRKLFIAAIRDISRQQQMENAVYESRKTQAIASLAGGIAHDFNNILTAVISQIDLALHSSEFPPTLKEHLIYAQTSARRGAELVSKLQAFGRQGQPVFAPIDVTEVIEQAMFMLRRSIDPKIVIEYSRPAAKPWMVKADSNQLIQALLNLSINARDAMPHGGRITFGAENVIFSAVDAILPRKAGEFVRMSVADTGYGMTAEVMRRVFEPYFSTKDLSRGPGLGLSITSAAIAEHGGWMEVDSQVGKGARFHCFLPRCEEPTAVPRRLASADTKITEGKERILVVDDEELVRMVTKAVLAYRGYQVTEAEDGEDAVAKFAAATTPFDLILMDLHMPRLNGYDALLKIREGFPTARAILLSGGVQEPDNVLGNLEGVAFLQKPFENQELVRLVRRMLNPTS